MTKKWPYLPFMRDVREGTVLQADDGFTCLDNGARRTVKRDTSEIFPLWHADRCGSTNLVQGNAPMNSRERLYIHCDGGRHYLSGQECHDGEHGIKTPHYVGLKIVSQP